MPALDPSFLSNRLAHMDALNRTTIPPSLVTLCRVIKTSQGYLPIKCPFKRGATKVGTIQFAIFEKGYYSRDIFYRGYVFSFFFATNANIYINSLCRCPFEYFIIFKIFQLE